MAWALIQYEFCPYRKGNFGHRNPYQDSTTWRWSRNGVQGEELPLKPPKAGKQAEISFMALKRNQPSQHPDFRFQTPVLGQHIYRLSHLVCGVCYSSPRKRTQAPFPAGWLELGYLRTHPSLAPPTSTWWKWCWNRPTAPPPTHGAFSAQVVPPLLGISPPSHSNLRHLLTMLIFSGLWDSALLLQKASAGIDALTRGANIPVCLGPKRFLGCRALRAETKKVLGKPEQVGHPTSLSSPIRSLCYFSELLLHTVRYDGLIYVWMIWPD